MVRSRTETDNKTGATENALQYEQYEYIIHFNLKNSNLIFKILSTV